MKTTKKNMKYSTVFFTIILFQLFMNAQCNSVKIISDSTTVKVDTSKKEKNPILIAEHNADKDAKEILRIGRIMTLEEKVIIPGSCWNYINTIFTRAGYENDTHVVFESSKKGPYANINLIKPGDWLYYVNHSYGNVEHSGIFVSWEDKAKKIALILSYVGGSRKSSGRYSTYKIDNVYKITRAGKE